VQKQRHLTRSTTVNDWQGIGALLLKSGKYYVMDLSAKQHYWLLSNIPDAMGRGVKREVDEHLALESELSGRRNTVRPGAKWIMEGRLRAASSAYEREYKGASYPCPVGNLLAPAGEWKHAG